MKQPITVLYECPACGKNLHVTCYPFVPSTYNSPEEGGHFEPSVCPGCEQPLPADDISGLYFDKVQAAQEAAAEAKLQRRRDGEYDSKNPQMFNGDLGELER